MRAIQEQGNNAYVYPPIRSQNIYRKIEVTCLGLLLQALQPRAFQLRELCRGQGFSA